MSCFVFRAFWERSWAQFGLGFCVGLLLVASLYWEEDGAYVLLLV